MTGTVAAIIVAAGRGTRVGGSLPKQYRPVAGVPVIRRSLELFARHAEIALVQPVIHDADRDLYQRAAGDLPVLPPVAGAETRQGSVRRGLEALVAHKPRVVLIHDAARPFASPALVSRAIVAAASGAAIPGSPVTDTIKVVDADNRVTATADRIHLRAVQTPQAFLFQPLLDAHRRAASDGLTGFTDDAALAEWSGMEVKVFEGEAGNVKLTTNEDFQRVEREAAAVTGDVRMGTGFDVHAFGPGDHVVLGGVTIPSPRGLIGHSDADVVLHALTDAVLGALADGDIGMHFPPSDPQWRGASSDRFLAFAVDRVRARGGAIAHLDATVICENPKIGPYRDAIRERIAAIAGVTPGRVGLKATTSEKLGFTGRGEGIAAMASATIRLPWGDAS